MKPEYRAPKALGSPEQTSGQTPEAVDEEHEVRHWISERNLSMDATPAKQVAKGSELVWCLEEVPQFPQPAEF